MLLIFIKLIPIAMKVMGFNIDDRKKNSLPEVAHVCIHTSLFR